MPIEKTILETGQEPEFRPDDFGTVEYLSDGSVRIAVCAEWRGCLRTEYFVRISKEALIRFGRRCMEIADDAHNPDELPEVVLEMTH